MVVHVLVTSMLAFFVPHKNKKLQIIIIIIIIIIYYFVRVTLLKILRSLKQNLN